MDAPSQEVIENGMKLMMKMITVMVGLGGALVASVSAAENAGSDGASAQRPAEALLLMEKWVETERQHSTERSQLVAKRAQEEKLKQLYRAELEAIEKQVQAAGSAHSSDMDALKQDQDYVHEAKAKREAMRDQLAGYRERIKAMHPRLPKVLQQQVEFAKATNPELGLKDGVLACTQYLQKVAQFNQSVHFAEEFHSINGEERQLQVLYLGLAKAYFVSGDIAGLGSAGAEGWSWKVDASVADEAARAIAIFNKNSRPDLVRLPVKHSK